MTAKGEKSPAKLTTEGYNEHADVSPNGSKIVWMSNVGNSNKGTDLWQMNPDGSDKVRLTYLNHPACPEYAGRAVFVADNSWSADGTRIVAYVLTNLLTQTGYLALIDLKP